MLGGSATAEAVCGPPRYIGISTGQISTDLNTFLSELDVLQPVEIEYRTDVIPSIVSSDKWLHCATAILPSILTIYMYTVHVVSTVRLDRLDRLFGQQHKSNKKHHTFLIKRMYVRIDRLRARSRSVTCQLLRMVG